MTHSKRDILRIRRNHLRSQSRKNYNAERNVIFLVIYVTHTWEFNSRVLLDRIGQIDPSFRLVVVLVGNKKVNTSPTHSTRKVTFGKMFRGFEPYIYIWDTLWLWALTFYFIEIAVEYCYWNFMYIKLFVHRSVQSFDFIWPLPVGFSHMNHFYLFCISSSCGAAAGPAFSHSSVLVGNMHIAKFFIFFERQLCQLWAWTLAVILYYYYYYYYYYSSTIESDSLSMRISHRSPEFDFTLFLVEFNVTVLLYTIRRFIYYWLREFGRAAIWLDGMYCSQSFIMTAFLVWHGLL